MNCVAVVYDKYSRTFRLSRKNLDAAMIDGETCDFLIPAELGVVKIEDATKIHFLSHSFTPLFRLCPTTREDLIESAV